MAPLNGPRVRKVKTKAPPKPKRVQLTSANAWDPVPQVGAVPDPNCTHSLNSWIGNHRFCSYCGGHLETR